MLFKEYHIPMIRSGSKTVTRREWSENYAGPNVGSVVAATTELFVSNEDADCWIRISDRYREALGELTDEDAQKEGDYETVDEFIEGYEDVYDEGSWDPCKVVDVVEFEYVGRQHPDDLAEELGAAASVAEWVKKRTVGWFHSPAYPRHTAIDVCPFCGEFYERHAQWVDHRDICDPNVPTRASPRGSND